MDRRLPESPRHGWIDFRCPTCGFDWPSIEAVYDPRRPKISRRIICRACWGRLARMAAPETSDPNKHSAWTQSALPTVSTETTDGTDPSVERQKAGQ